MAGNIEKIPYLAAKLWVAPYITGIPTFVKGTNEATVTAYIEANATFYRFARVINPIINENIGEGLVTVRGDECDVRDERFTKPSIIFTCEYNESVDIDGYCTVTGATKSTVAGTPVAGATQTASSGSWSYNKFIKIGNQNGDGSAITVNSVTGGTDGVLVADTDYYVGQNDAGEYGVFIIDSATVTTESQDMVIDYDYTPNAKTYISVVRTTISVPSVILKVETCESISGKTNTYYIVDATFTGTWATSFVDIAENGSINPTTLEFTTNNTGYKIGDIQSV